MLTDVPILLNSLLEDIAQPVSLFDQNFGLGLAADDFIHPSSLMRMPLSRGYYRPWRVIRGKDSGVSNMISSDSEFKVNLDVQQFKPEQLSVKVVDNSVIVEGKHEERKDEHGFISRQFKRRYILPANVNPSGVQSNLSSDGVLTITAPKSLPPSNNERVVPIVQTRQPAITSKQEEKGKPGAEGETMES